LAQVLVERDGRGRTEAFAPFRIIAEVAVPSRGDIATARADRVEGGILIGRLAT
jgi:hypothetical protein